MSATKLVHVIQTGIANTASIVAGLERIGAVPEFTSKPDDVSQADFVVLPGVGAFKAGMDHLKEYALVDCLKQRIADNRPTLAVCVGLQLFFSESEESQGTKGLGIFPLSISRFSDSVRVPQLGWNLVEAQSEMQYIEPGYAYFANSYRATEVPQGWRAAYAEHGGRFIAALERGRILCCQFHPELSGSWGTDCLSRWLRAES